MIEFTKPESLNGAQLLAELASEGVIVKGKAHLDDNLILWLDIASKDKTKAEAVVSAHVGIDQVS
jgi:hypothetical protein